MGFLSRLFRTGESAAYAPPSDAFKQGIVLLALSRNFDGLAANLRSKNPYIRVFAIDAVLQASQIRSLGGGQMQFSADHPFDPRGVRLLIPLLDDGDAAVRKRAEAALTSVANGSRAGQVHDEAARALEAYRMRASSAGPGQQA